MTRPYGGGCQWEARLMELLRDMNKNERANYLMRYAVAFGRKYIVTHDKNGRFQRRLRGPSA